MHTLRPLVVAAALLLAQPSPPFPLPTDSVAAVEETIISQDGPALRVAEAIAVAASAFTQPHEELTIAVTEAVDDLTFLVDTEEKAQSMVGAGDAAMNEGDPAIARISYGAVVDYAPDSKLAPYAAYKLAWCEWSLRNQQQAIAEMGRVVSWLEGNPDSPLYQEAVRDLQEMRSKSLTVASPDAPAVAVR